MRGHLFFANVSSAEILDNCGQEIFSGGIFCKTSNDGLVIVSDESRLDSLCNLLTTILRVLVAHRKRRWEQQFRQGNNHREPTQIVHQRDEIQVTSDKLRPEVRFALSKSADTNSDGNTHTDRSRCNGKILQKPFRQGYQTTPSQTTCSC